MTYSHQGLFCQTFSNYFLAVQLLPKKCNVWSSLAHGSQQGICDTADANNPKVRPHPRCSRRRRTPGLKPSLGWRGAEPATAAPSGLISPAAASPIPARSPGPRPGGTGPRKGSREGAALTCRAARSAQPITEAAIFSGRRDRACA